MCSSMDKRVTERCRGRAGEGHGNEKEEGSEKEGRASEVGFKAHLFYGAPFFIPWHGTL